MLLDGWVTTTDRFVGLCLGKVKSVVTQRFCHIFIVPVQTCRPNSIFCCGNLVNTLELNKPKNLKCLIVTPNSNF